MPVAFLTNTTSRTRHEIATALEGAGIAVSEHELVTAGSATAAFLAERYAGARALVLNEGPLDDFAAVELVVPGKVADVVVIGAAGASFTWETMNHAARAILHGADLVAMHGTASWQTADGICIDGGAYVTLLERATGCVATTIGKPTPQMFGEALARLGVAAEEAVMVGDDLAADVVAAQAAGIRGVLVRTGKFRPETLTASAEQPDAVIDSIADLPAWLGAL